MTNREAGINVVREMMGDQAAAKLSSSADSNTFGAPIAAYALDSHPRRFSVKPEFLPATTAVYGTYVSSSRSGSLGGGEVT